jgi:hypothetical protein
MFMNSQQWWAMNNTGSAELEALVGLLAAEGENRKT